MPLPRVRFTVRRLMVVVAIIGLLFGCAGFLRRSAMYARKSEMWRGVEELYGHELQVDGDFKRRMTIESKERKLDPMERAQLAEAERAAVKDLLMREYARSLRRKYLCAARYPFLPVAPDPPEPE